MIKKLLIALVIVMLLITGGWLFHSPETFAQAADVWFPTGGGNKYLKPVNNLWGLLVPGLATSTTGCLSVAANGWISPSGSACGSSSSSSGGSTGNSKWATSSDNSYITPNTANVGIIVNNSTSTIKNLNMVTSTSTFASSTSFFATNASTTNATSTFGFIAQRLGIGANLSTVVLDVSTAASNATFARFTSPTDVNNLDIVSLGAHSVQLRTGATDTFGIGVNNSATSQFVIRPWGAVGVGTTTPQWAFQIASTSGPQLTISDSSTLTNDHWSFRNAAMNFYLSTSSASVLGYPTSTVNAIWIDPNGKLTFGSPATTSFMGDVNAVNIAGNIGLFGTSSTSTIQGLASGTSTLKGFLDVTGSNSTSTFTGNLVTNRASTTATSTFAGLRLRTQGLDIDTIASCNSTSALTTDASGNVVCGAITGSGGTTGAQSSTTASFVIYTNNALSTTPTYFLFNATSTTVTSGTNFQTLLAQAVSSLGGGGAYSGTPKGTGPGGIIFINPGYYYTNATTTVNGNDLASTDNGPEIKIVGSGRDSTKIIVNSDADFISFDHIAIPTVSDMSIYLKGKSNGIVATSSNPETRSLWQGDFHNILIAATTTHTGRGINMDGILRSRFDNIEFFQVHNCARFTASGNWNPGDFTFNRSFCELDATAGGVAFEFATSSSRVKTGFVNQVKFDMVEGIANSTGATFIKAMPLVWSSFNNLNAEQFDTMVDTVTGYNSISNDYNFNYLTPRAAVGLTLFKLASGAQANKINVKDSNNPQSITIVSDANANDTARNLFSGYIGQDGGTGSVTNTGGTLMIRDIFGYGTLDTTLAPGGFTGVFDIAGQLRLLNGIADGCLRTTSGLVDSTTCGSGGTGAGNSKWATSTVNSQAISPNAATVVGIGTTTPKWALQIASSTGAQLTLSDSANITNPHWSFRNIGGSLYIATSSPTTFGTSTVGTLFIDSNGTLGLGTTTVNKYAKFTIASTSPVISLTDTDAATDRKHLLIGNYDGVFTIGTSTDQLNATSSSLTYDPGQNANLGVGTTSPYAKVSIQATSTDPFYSDLFAIGSSTLTVNTTHFRVSNSGTIFAPNTTSSGASQTGYWCYDANGQLIRDTAVCLVSAKKFKKDIVPLNLGLNDLLKFEPVSYYKKDPLDVSDSHKQIGFVADDVAKISPEVNETLVTYDSNGDVHGFRYEQFTALLTKSIQELNAKVDMKKGISRVEENWQWALILLLLGYVVYNEIDKRKKR